MPGWLAAAVCMLHAPSLSSKPCSCPPSPNSWPDLSSSSCSASEVARAHHAAAALGQLQCLHAVACLTLLLVQGWQADGCSRRRHAMERPRRHQRQRERGKPQLCKEVSSFLRLQPEPDSPHSGQLVACT